MSTATAILQVKPGRQDVATSIDQADRKAIAQGLSHVLGDTYMLLVKTHVYHWNVVGPLFLPLHELTEAHYNDLFAAADVIAERIRALGFTTPLNFASMARNAELSEEKAAGTAEEMVEQLASDHETIVRSIRELAEQAESRNDYVTHDMLVGRLTFHEKAIWMLRAITTS